jgi:hypothetical protein
MKSKWEFSRPVYTVEEHVKKLVAILSRDKPCKCCPAAPNLSGRCSPQDIWSDEVDHPCRICREFVGLSWDDERGRWDGKLSGCPCNALGEEEALRITFEALKAYQREMIL